MKYWSNPWLHQTPWNIVSHLQELNHSGLIADGLWDCCVIDLYFCKRRFKLVSVTRTQISPNLVSPSRGKEQTSFKSARTFLSLSALCPLSTDVSSVTLLCAFTPRCLICLMFSEAAAGGCSYHLPAPAPPEEVLGSRSRSCSCSCPCLADGITVLSVYLTSQQNTPRSRPYWRTEIDPCVPETGHLAWQGHTDLQSELSHMTALIRLPPLTIDSLPVTGRSLLLHLIYARRDGDVEACVVCYLFRQFDVFFSHWFTSL